MVIGSENLFNVVVNSPKYQSCYFTLQLKVVIVYKDIEYYLPCLQAVWNSAMLQTEDILKAVQANVQKEKPIFAKL